VPASLTFSEFSLRPDGSPVDFELPAGHSLAIMGPCGSGKTAVIDCLTGRSMPPRGTVRTSGTVVEAKSSGGRRLRPQAIAQRRTGADRAGLAGEALTATALWDVRQTSVDRLSPGQQTACELLEPLTAKPQLIVIDGHLDRLDPWTLHGVLTLLRKRMREGISLLVATNRPDIAQDFDHLLVLRALDRRILGAPADLLHKTPSEILVESLRSEAARAIAEPLSLSMRRTADGLRIHAEEGQELSAKLLVEGYGDVKATFLKAPSFEEALLRI
jgi:ABC-type multidrug transport system ATPase subunit